MKIEVKAGQVYRSGTRTLTITHVTEGGGFAEGTWFPSGRATRIRLGTHRWAREFKLEQDAPIGEGK